MSKSKERVIKLTRDGRFHSMGLVVNTFDEAIERAERKGIGNYFLEYPSEEIEVNGNKLSFEAGICGTQEYLRQWII